MNRPLSADPAAPPPIAASTCGLFGLSMTEVPADFFDKWQAFWAARGTIDPGTVALAAAALATIIGLRRYAPKAPG